MAATSQREFALQMVAQLRALDPAMSAEVGTPERKIIDTVAQALAETQIDLTVLSGALDLDSKFGDNLDTFLSLLGFGRQKATKGVGFVNFSRPTASTFNIPIPGGTQLVAAITSTDSGALSLTTNTIFQTTLSVVLKAGQTQVSAPVEAVLPGISGNVDANTITQIAGQTVLGVTQVTNPAATTNGLDEESDEEFKVRFKNTVFRNLSGTPDQYLALAVSTAFTTKANVVGPISRYREYIQIPDVNDAETDPDSGVSGNGAAGEYTTALSTVPYSKHVYSDLPYFVTNGRQDLTQVFFRQDTDFYLNLLSTTKNRGDTYRELIQNVGDDPASAGATFRPNITFLNVYTGGDPDIIAVRPGNVVLFEHSYMSTASRNSPDRNIHNCVDIYVNGVNKTEADAVVVPPSTSTAFVDNATSPWHFDNFRRFGEPNHRPVIGNLFTGLFYQPVVALPEQITVGSVTYLLNTHYWIIQDITQLGGTTRTRNGIEWAIGVKGIAANDPNEGPWTGPIISANVGEVAEVNSYFFDKNIVDLQVALEGAKQTTTDVLAHQAIKRYFKLDITVMYTNGFSSSDVNQGIHDNLVTFFNSLYYGQAIQLSDLLAVVHNTLGVDNVRWSQDLLSVRNRVVECDINGKPLLNVILDLKTLGDPSTTEVWHMYTVGNPSAGSFTVTQGVHTTSALSYNVVAADITAALAAASISATVTSGAGATNDPWVITFSANGTQTSRMTTSATFTAGGAIYNGDFFLKDDELPALPNGELLTDSEPGLIIRAKAQSTWNSL